MTERLYFSYSTQELNKLSQNSDHDVLIQVLHELEHRKTKSARLLRTELRDKLSCTQELGSTGKADSENHSNKDIKKKTQNDFINAEFSRNISVEAPPGTGKTYSLIKRLERHVRMLGKKDEANMILVLSFSRNAVNEIRERLITAIESGADHSLRYIGIKTIDSFCYSLLKDDPNVTLLNGYEQNIKKLTELLQTETIEGQTGKKNRFRWLYIDEVQDLVGCRAQLVLELIKEAHKRQGIATILGDPKQGVMDFQINKDNCDLTNSQFLARFTTLCGENHEQIIFEKSFRFITEVQQTRVNAVRKLMDTCKQEDICDEMQKLIPPFQGTFPGKLNDSETTGVLCFKNRDALQCYDYLKRSGYNVTINKGSDDVPHPVWLWAVFGTWQQKYMSTDMLRSKLAVLHHKIPVPAWREVEKSLTASHALRGDVVDVEQIFRRIHEGKSWHYTQDSHSNLIVSTIHKSKGLQYDHVLCNTDFPRKHSEQKENVLYVAITRGRKSVRSFNRKTEGLCQPATENTILLRGEKDIYEDSMFKDTESELDFTEVFQALTKAATGGDVRFLISYDSNRETVLLNILTESKRYLPIVRISKFIGKKMDKAGTLRLDPGQPDEYITIAYRGNNPMIEMHLGPGGLLPVPIFYGKKEIAHD